MTTSVGELNDLFDLLYNNLASEGAANIDNFEKSMLLTKAQTEVVNNHIVAMGNKYQVGAEGSDKRTLELAPLILTSDVSMTMTNTDMNYQGKVGSSQNADIQYIKILNEIMVVKDSNNDIQLRRQVLPISYGEYERYVSKPGGEPLKRQVWKVILDSNNNSLHTSVMFVFNQADNSVIDNLSSVSYEMIIRGYRKPTPIILEDLAENLSIDGNNVATEFYLPLLKDEIVQRAVEIAKGSYSSDENGNAQLQNQITLGQRSE